MSSPTAQALLEAIEHWRENEHALTLYEVHMGSDSCSLCELFLDDYCEGCPVHTHTGQVSCRGTPYSATLRSFVEWALAEHYRQEYPFPWLAVWRAREAFHIAAKAERQFLETLLP